ncbi:predicted protein [Histoplasma mississippiense (nom. inval.)]|uniref:predicted protein n=1 Tax=Ajellomyces capsulatus (strain NAm1 / WU24) TaxID=2059318 RepID=UPI000157D06D|nr:predicted protein [Histoplasma mississippiense (nom. inval.)]EDN04259.1 predicted protein [Histoplasma mississippiense (nom. inval.)]
MPPVNRGLHFDGIESLPRLKLGARVARKMLLEAHKWTGKEALNGVIIDVVVEPERMFDIAMELAEKWAPKTKMGNGNYKTWNIHQRRAGRIRHQPTQTNHHLGHVGKVKNLAFNIEGGDFIAAHFNNVNRSVAEDKIVASFAAGNITSFIRPSASWALAVATSSKRPKWSATAPEVSWRYALIITAPFGGPVVPDVKITTPAPLPSRYFERLDQSTFCPASMSLRNSKGEVWRPAMKIAERWLSVPSSAVPTPSSNDIMAIL